MLQEMTTMLKRIYSPISRQARRLATEPAKARLEVKMDEDVYNKIDKEEMKARKHPGRLSTRVVEFPEWFSKALQNVLEDTSINSLLKDGINLSNHLHNRQLPTEQSVAQTKYAQIKEDLASQKKFEKLANTLETESVEKIIHAKSLQLLKRAFYGWSPIEYNKYAGLVYLVSMSGKEYAVLYRIMNEIATRDKTFKPKSLFDFGSGVGSTLWVVNDLWPQNINEHMCVDVSTDMNDLSESIISHAEPKIKGVFYRQYIPISHRTYDIVVSAYTLLELPSMQTRLETIAKLWAKTKQYLIIVETGTNSGFRVINEARDFILHMQRSRPESDPQIGHIFSPCPHELRCPRYNDRTNTPCNFQTTYQPLPLKNREKTGTTRYSYVVFKKGKNTDETQHWPRLVRETIVRSKHSFCRMCTAQGKLEEVLFRTSLHGKWMYWCARSSRWGDRLPVETLDKPKVQEEDKEENVVDEETAK